MKRLKFYFIITMTLIINSCGVNEEIGNQTSPKATTYVKPASINELLSDLENRNDELADFIISNPFSNFKQDDAKTDYFFDLEHIYVVKNDKNEAAYMIPVYIKSDISSSFLYSLSVEITNTEIDVKLVTKEPTDNGTFDYYGSSFDMYKKSSSTGKTKQIDCYCTKVVSDCTCHTTHAASGCDHPSVTISCNCSGSSVPPPAPGPGDATKTSWTSSGGAPTAYTPNGDGVYMALRKIFKPEYELSPLQKYAIVNNVPYSSMLIDFLNQEGKTPANKAFVSLIIYAIEDAQFSNLKQLSNSLQNFIYSQKSPLDVDLSHILNNLDLPENKKFNEIYKNLTESPEFKKLFLDIFADSNKFNVNFEINDHVYEDNDPLKKEVHATTSQNPITKAITIKVSKQILIAGTTMSQTNIENAKTILHECIHAYLFVKANNPSVGADFVKTLNTMYPTPKEQHDFMYNRMIPTMQTVLSEIRDLVTTIPKRILLEDYTMYPTTNPLTSTKFNWSDFYKYLSLNGLNETSCFKEDFPEGSDALSLLNQYVRSGKIELDR
ncbi:hypothetical protein JI750_18795 [Flavobacterium sp. GN10]|uniref:SprT-like family protein n=1 Tax=Flavobacterium tagetis TaxID=2801336 RepID=A0ABS1KHV4_9FLAO|nr:hypothetical protein [Flavobacterium tagetis]MBL0738950.1 hypothetical protein [Flavobacterium tagetis]